MGGGEPTVKPCYRGGQQEIADQVGVARSRVSKILSQKTVRTEKRNNPKREIADQVGVSQRRVGQILEEKTVRTEKTSNPKRAKLRYEITSYTKPETAAQKKNPQAVNLRVLMIIPYIQDRGLPER